MEKNNLHTFQSLLLVDFISIDETGDLLPLIKYGDSSSDELINRWMDIVNKFNEKTKSETAGELYSIVQESRQQHKINMLEGLWLLWYIDNPYCLKILAEKNIKITTRNKLYSRIQNEKNRQKIQKKQSKRSDDGEAKKVDWWDLIAMLGESTPPISIDVNKQTIAQFAGIINRAQKRNNGRR